MRVTSGRGRLYNTSAGVHLGWPSRTLGQTPQRATALLRVHMKAVRGCALTCVCEMIAKPVAHDPTPCHSLGRYFSTLLGGALPEERPSVVCEASGSGAVDPVIGAITAHTTIINGTLLPLVQPTPGGACPGMSSPVPGDADQHANRRGTICSLPPPRVEIQQERKMCHSAKGGARYSPTPRQEGQSENDSTRCSCIGDKSTGGGTASSPRGEDGGM